MCLRIFVLKFSRQIQENFCVPVKILWYEWSASKCLFTKFNNSLSILVATDKEKGGLK